MTYAVKVKQDDAWRGGLQLQISKSLGQDSKIDGIIGEVKSQFLA